MRHRSEGVTSRHRLGQLKIAHLRNRTEIETPDRNSVRRSLIIAIGRHSLRDSRMHTHFIYTIANFPILAEQLCIVDSPDTFRDWNPVAHVSRPAESVKIRHTPVFVAFLSYLRIEPFCRVSPVDLSYMWGDTSSLQGYWCLSLILRVVVRRLSPVYCSSRSLSVDVRVSKSPISPLRSVVSSWSGGRGRRRWSSATEQS